MAKTVDIDLIINTAGSERSVAQAKDAIVQLQRELKRLGNDADEAFVNKTNNAIGQTKAQLQDLKDEIDSVRPDKVGSAFLTLGQSIAGSFQLASGAIAAFGGESKEIEKVQTQLLAVTNIAGGLGNLKESAEDFGRAFQVVNTIMKANPIGTVVVALGALAAAYAFLVPSQKESIANQKKENEEREKGRIAALKQVTELTDVRTKEFKQKQDLGRQDLQSQIDLAKASGANAQELFNLERSLLTKKIADQEELVKTFEGDPSGEIRIGDLKKLQAELNVLDTEFKTNQIAKNKEQSDKILAQQKADNEKQKQALIEYNNAIKQIDSESLNEFQKISEEEFNKKQELQTQFDNLTLEQRTARQTEFDEKIRKIELDAITKTNELKKQKEDETIQNEKDRLQKLSDTRQLGFENQLLQLELDGQLTKEKELEIERQKFEDLKLLTVEGSEEQKALILEYKETLLRINKEYNEKELEDDKKKEEQKARNLQFGVQSAIQTANLISNIATSFAGKSEKAAKKAFNISKAAQIASALGATYLSATQAFASQFLPIPDPTSPVRGGIAAGLAVAAGLANVAKISQTKFEGGNTNPGGTTPNTNIGDLGGGNIPTTATQATPQASIINQQIGAIDQNGFKVFVTETDITSVINKVDVIESQSKFG